MGVDEVGGSGDLLDDFELFEDLGFGLGSAEADDLDGEDHAGVVLVDGFVDCAVEAFADEVHVQDVGFELVGDNIMQLDQF